MLRSVVDTYPGRRNTALFPGIQPWMPDMASWLGLYTYLRVPQDWQYVGSTQPQNGSSLSPVYDVIMHWFSVFWYSVFSRGRFLRVLFYPEINISS